MTAARDFFWVAIGRLVTALVGLATIRLSTGLLPPAQFGVLSILLTLQHFCGLFLVNPVGQYIHRYTHEWVDETSLLARLRKYRLWVVVAGGAGALTSGIWTLSQPLLWEDRILIVAAVALMVVSATWNGTSVFLLNMLGHRALSVGWAAVTVFLGLALSWALTTVSGAGLSWFTGQALALAIGAIGAGYTVRRLLPRPTTDKWKLLEPGILRSYIIPLAMATGFMWWLLSGYRLFMEAHWGLAELGRAVVGLSLASQLWSLVESLAMQFLYPLFYRRIADIGTPDSALAFSDLLNTLGPIYLVLAAATVAGAQSLLLLLVDSTYQGVVTFVLLGAAIECCRTLSNLLATAAQVDRQMRMLIPPYGAGALALTVGLLVLTRFDASITQAVMVLAGAGVITLVVMAIVMSRLQAFRLDLVRWAGAMVPVALSVYLVSVELLGPVGVVRAVASVVAIGVVVATWTVALLWKNPGTKRLLAVQLRPPGKQG